MSRPHRNIAADAALGALCVAGFVLLFSGGPDYSATRLIKAVWNLGHVPLFACLTVMFLRLTESKVILPWQARISMATLLALLLGVVTEVLQQRFFQRTFSWFDLAADLGGCWLALCWYPPLRNEYPKTFGRVLTFASTVVILALLIPTFRIVYDDRLASAQWPLLAGFETASEMSRWSGGAAFARERHRASEGEYSLRIRLDTARYSGVGFRHFPADWSGFHRLAMDVWTEVAVPLTVRIHDRQHEFGDMRYEDRFNRRFPMNAGWNRIAIELRDVQRAPKSRVLDLRRILSVGIFSTALSREVFIHIDNLRLD